jgi:hypothetical protein
MISALVFAAWVQGSSPQSLLPLRSIERGQISSIDEPRQTVARSPQEWAALWRAHARDRPLPDVDFSKEMVVAVFLGSRPTAGFSVEITGMKEASNGTLIVQYREAAPRADAVTAQIITAPFHIVAIPRRAGEVVFEKVER